MEEIGNGVSFSGVSGLGLSPQGFVFHVIGQEDREGGCCGGLLDLKHLMGFVKIGGRYDEMNSFQYCDFGEETIDASKGLDETQGIGVNDRPSSIQVMDGLEEDFLCTSPGGVPDHISGNDRKFGTPRELRESTKGSDTGTRSVGMHETVAEGMPDNFCSDSRENMQSERDASSNLSIQGKEGASTADRNVQDKRDSSDYANCGEKNADELSQDNHPSSEDVEVCILDSMGVSAGGMKQPNRAHHRPKQDDSVIIINDDNSEGENTLSTDSAFYSIEDLNGEDSDSDEEVSSPLMRQSESSSSLESSSSDDDCLVLERPTFLRGKRPRTRLKSKTCNFTFNALSSRRNGWDDSSDCEIMVGSQDEIRMHWEEAALKRRLCKPMQSRGSRVGRADSGVPCNLSSRKGGTKSDRDRFMSSLHQDSEFPRQTTSRELAESVATSHSSEFSCKRDNLSTGKGKVQEPKTSPASEDWLECDRIQIQRNSMHCKRDSGRWFPPNRTAAGVNLGKNESERDTETRANGVAESNGHCTSPEEDWLELNNIKIRRMDTGYSGRSSGSQFMETLAAKVMPGHMMAEDTGLVAEPSYGNARAGKEEGDLISEASHYQSPNPPHTKEAEVLEDRHNLVNGVDEGAVLAGDRERIKETEEFKKADEEEWARRQVELERQALEARRLRKRKRAEADRKLEMENRQKQRLEEIRENQQLEKKNLGMKEQLRGQIRAELERKALGCRDMASLLRHLGISVEGGAFPTPEQVNAAYKRALLRFHPDRAVALAHGNPRLQVEAEETFKLMSRLKSSLPPVACPYLY